MLGTEARFEVGIVIDIKKNEEGFVVSRFLRQYIGSITFCFPAAMTPFEPCTHPFLQLFTSMAIYILLPLSYRYPTASYDYRSIGIEYSE